MRLDLPNVTIKPLPDLAGAISTGFSGELKAQFPEIFSENVSSGTSLRAYSAAAGPGLLPELSGLGFTSKAVDATIALTDNGSEFSREIGNAVRDNIRNVALEGVGDFLKDEALPIMQDVIGDVVEPLVGAIPVLGGFIKAAISIFRFALKRSGEPSYPPPPTFESPTFNPATDVNLASSYADDERTDITDLFLPPSLEAMQGYTGDLTLAERVFTVRNLENDQRQIIAVGNISGAAIEGGRGFVPGTGTSGIRAGGSPYLHDSLILDKSAQARTDGTTVGVFDTGDFVPTTRSVLLNTWASVNTPSPMLWTVDAERVADQWLLYVKYLRDFLHGTVVKSRLTAQQARAADTYFATRLLRNRGEARAKGTRVFTLNQSDERLRANLVPYLAAKHLLRQQAWGQSHRSGLILFADAYDRDWGAFASNGSLTAQQMRAAYKTTRSNFVNRNPEAVCTLFKDLDSIPAYNRTVVENRAAALGCGSRVREGTRTVPAGNRPKNPLAAYATGVAQAAPADPGDEGFEGGQDQDKGTQDPNMPGAAAGSGLAALIAVGLLGGTLMLGKK